MLGIENQQNNFGYSAGTLAKPFAQRPTRAALGTLFVSTDTLKLYRWTGTAWVEIASSGGTITGANNGLSVSGANVGIGGTLIQNTTIDAAGYIFSNINSTFYDVYSSQVSFRTGENPLAWYIYNDVAGKYMLRVSTDPDEVYIVENGGNFFIGNAGAQSLQYNESVPSIKTTYSGSSIGFNLDFANSVYWFGEENNLFGYRQDANNLINIGKYDGGGNYFQVNSVQIIGYCGAASFYGDAGTMQIGDVFGTTNSTIFSVSDSLQQFVFSNGNVLIGTGINNGLKLQVEGQVSTIGSSVSNPAFTFGNDLDTGMYRSSANTIGFTCGGTRELTVSATGLRCSAQLIDTSTSGAFKMGLYTAGAIAATGTVKLEINGVVYRLLTST